MSEIELNINIDEANLMLEALGQLPFARVYALIAKIQDQAAQQFKDKETQATTEASGVTQLDAKVDECIEGRGA